MEGRRVCVIGAGLAGLAAAEALRRAGARPLVLEGRDRVGGRVWTSTVGDGHPVEMGAEFVTDGYEVLPAVAEQLGLRLTPMGMSFGDREPRGGLGTTRPKLEHACRTVAAAIEQGGLADVSFGALLERLPLDAGARELIACRVSVSYAHPADRIAACAVRDVLHLFQRTEARRVAEGNQSLALRLAERVEVQTTSPVRRIAWGDDGVTVDGLAADACVLAVPAHAAGSIAFDPPLPDWKTRALEAVVYGDAAKLFVPLAAAVPPSSVLSVPGRFWTWTARSGDGEMAPVVHAFAGSAAAVRPLLHGTAYTEAVRALRPDLALLPCEARVAAWDEGAYSTKEPGRPRDEDAALARPVSRLAFAGEHTAGPWFATMEGALRSGFRAAADVRVALGRR
jgi:monoamine oxidase